MTIEDFIKQISRPMFIWLLQRAILTNEERYSAGMVKSARTRRLNAESEIAALIQSYIEDATNN